MAPRRSDRFPLTRPNALRPPKHRRPQIQTRRLHPPRHIPQPHVELADRTPPHVASAQHGHHHGRPALRIILRHAVVLQPRIEFTRAGLGHDTFGVLYNRLLYVGLHGWKAGEEDGYV
eukprot:7947533-Ditylum_brightwellii.AAC.1